ncbi:MAG: ribonuclease III [Thermomicrobiales bacterium]|nr:ribonuclease III [Thermomicrobiales bacterium]MCO5228815.1 ribonuclease III [Thermomicrobiales bacterium]
MSDSKPTPFRTPDLATELALAQRLGVSFADPYQLRLALTHRSVLHEWTQHGEIDAIMQNNERLEFLGDAVLGFVTADRLYRSLPVALEGELTRGRVALVRAETLVDWATALGVPEALYLGTGEAVTDSPRDRILAGAMEAIIGAIYLDQGQDVVTSFISSWLDTVEPEMESDDAVANPKGRLQEVVQERKLEQPVYETVAEDGPEHARVFTIDAIVNGQRIGTGIGRSKREAQQIAAREALAAIVADESILETKE